MGLAGRRRARKVCDARGYGLGAIACREPSIAHAIGNLASIGGMGVPHSGQFVALVARRAVRS